MTAVKKWKKPKNTSSAAREQRQLRRIASGEQNPSGRPLPRPTDTGVHHTGLLVTGVEMNPRRGGTKYGGTVSLTALPGRGGVGHDPRTLVGLRIQEALDPSTVPRPAKTFKDMTPEEQAEMRRLYEKKGSK